MIGHFIKLTRPQQETLHTQLSKKWCLNEKGKVPNRGEDDDGNEEEEDPTDDSNYERSNSSSNEDGNEQHYNE